MPRFARIVVPGQPHHVIQRGNRRQRAFFCEDDYRVYKSLLREWCDKFGVSIMAYCLIPNHTHAVAIPSAPDSLARAFGGCHERYTRYVNQREGWSGYLWQGRFRSHPMDESHLINALRYVVRNPVAAGLVDHTYEWQHSSAHSLLSGKPDGLTNLSVLSSRVSDWAQLLEVPIGETTAQAFEKHLSSGRPLGDPAYLHELEARTGRKLIPRPVGRPPGGANGK